MKFKKVTPKEFWSKEKTEQAIEKVLDDIRTFNRQINSNLSLISRHENEIRVISRRLSNKMKYLNQLKEQLKERG